MRGVGDRRGQAEVVELVDTVSSMPSPGVQSADGVSQAF